MYYLPPDTADRVRVNRLHSATFDNVQDYINFFGDRVIITGGQITATLPADGTVAVNPCTAWCKETDSDTAIGVFFDFAGVGNIALADLTANILYLDYNAGTPQVVLTASPLTYGFQQDHILLGAVFRNGAATHIVNANRLGIQGDNRSHMMRVEEGASRTSGMLTLAAGVRNLTITAGVLHLGLNRITTPARDTTPAGGDTFTYWYYDGSLPVPAWVAVPGATQISNTQYNNVALGLVAFTPNRYGVHWVFMDFDGHLHVVYGQGDYTAAQAENADVPAPLPNAVLMFSVIVAKIICQQGAAVLTITYPWTIPFVSALANDHSLLANLLVDDHPQYIRHALATAANDFLVAPAPGSFVKQTLAQVTAILNWAADIATHSALTTGVHGVGGSTVDSVAARDAAILVETLARALADFMHETITTPPIHGSTVAANFDTLIHRDAAGRAKIVNPAVNADIDNLGARAAAIAAHAALTTGTHGAGANTIWHGGLTDIINRTHLGQIFGPSGARLLNLILTPVAGEIFRQANASTTPFSGDIAGNPTAVSVVYDNEVLENSITGITADALRWGRMILHNTTRGNSRKIVSANIVTNTITTDASVDDWANNDVITIQSQTNAQVGYVDIDVSAEIAPTVVSIYALIHSSDNSLGANPQRTLFVHPYEAYDAGKRVSAFTLLAGEGTSYAVFIPVIDQKFTIMHRAMVDNYTILSILGWGEYADI